jgi:hypothetical protein
VMGCLSNKRTGQPVTLRFGPGTLAEVALSLTGQADAPVHLPRMNQMSSRSWACFLLVGFLAVPWPALAVEPPDRNAASPNATRPHYSAEESAALGAAARRLAEEQQRKWDRRLNQISGSICNGC